MIRKNRNNRKIHFCPISDWNLLSPNLFPLRFHRFLGVYSSLQPSAFSLQHSCMRAESNQCSGGQICMQRSMQERLTKQPTVEPVILLKATQSDFISMWLIAEFVKNLDRRPPASLATLRTACALKSRRQSADKSFDVKVLSRHHRGVRARLSICRRLPQLVFRKDLPCRIAVSLPQLSSQQMFTCQTSQSKTTRKQPSQPAGCPGF
jgi:hypothetical protein